MRALTPDQLLEAVSIALGAAGCGAAADLIKPALRRAAFVLAPASRSDVVWFAAAPLEALGVGADQVEEALEELITYGDVLEVRRLEGDPWSVQGMVLRPAPPSFVARPDGTIFILGVAGDFPTALTPDLQERVDDAGPVRVLRSAVTEGLAGHLKLLGMTQLSEGAWLRVPAFETAAAHVAGWRKRLDLTATTPGGVPELEILDPSRRVNFYKGRWLAPNAQTHGLRLARRPQVYGRPLWSVAEFDRGVALRVVDLYEDEDRQRPCDLGWRFQAAFDQTLGHPQEVRVRHVGSRAVLDFFSPLPAFAERRLMLAGNRTMGPGRLFSFEMTTEAAAAELADLERTLWMRVAHDEVAP